MSTLYPPTSSSAPARLSATYDIFSRLLMDRIVFLGVPINDDVPHHHRAAALTSRHNPEKNIYLYVNRRAGCVVGMAILRHDASSSRRR